MTKSETVIGRCKQIEAVTPKEKYIKRNMIKFYKEKSERIEKLPDEYIESYSFVDEFNRKVSECTIKFD